MDGPAQARPARLHINSDLHAAALVWIDRRKVIEELIIQDYRRIDPLDIQGIVQSCQFLSCCTDECFDRLSQQVTV